MISPIVRQTETFAKIIVPRVKKTQTKRYLGLFRILE